MSDRLCILVTGVGGGGHGEQILKALRRSAHNYEIIGTDTSRTSKGFAMVDHAYLLPEAGHPRYIDCLLALCKKHRVRAVFHGSEPELKVMNRERERIESEGIFLPINPSSVIETCMDKNKTMTFLKEGGFCYPQSVEIATEGSLDQVDFFPAVLKPSIGAGGSANIMLAQNREELLLFGKYLLSLYPTFIAQEYVGTPDSEFTVGILCDMSGIFINSIAVKRNIISALSNRIKIPNRTTNSTLGDTLVISSGISQGLIGKFPSVTKPCEQIALRLGCRGAINIQCRYVEDRVYVFEINPRFSGTTSLRSMVGYNEPDILIRKHILGEHIAPHFNFTEGYIARGLDETLISSQEIGNSEELLHE